ncbi:MAG: hypothetical protein IPJ40_03590 [Saprospirales bacterium]|nr:hypothetical protein [Saprospirales bacterium]
MISSEKIVVLLAFTLFGASWLPAQTAVSDKRIEAVVSHFESHSDIIDSLACVFDQDAIPVLAVVGPEWVRYSMVRDLMETAALEFAYVRFGAEAADFSIGPFQMKPSFIEDLEIAVGQAADLPAHIPFTMAYSTSDPVLQRRVRIQRMKDLRWQYFYAFAFFSLSQNRFADLLSADTNQQIAFFAAAYNFGFTRPAPSIEKWQSVEVFPYGSAFLGKQESYSGVALRFYGALKGRFGKIW